MDIFLKTRIFNQNNKNKTNTSLRSYPSYDDSNVVGQLYTGDTVELISNTTDGSYVQVFAPRLGLYGYVNAGFLA